MSEINVAKLVKASDIAVTNEVQHLVLMVADDGRLCVNGSSNFMKAFYENRHVSSAVEKVLKSSFIEKKKEEENNNEAEKIVAEGVVSYPLLPCSPFSDEWNKLSLTETRKVLTGMINSAGIIRSGKRRSLGVNTAPCGRPEDVVSWSQFKGASRSKLSKPQVKAIILKLFEAANVNPATHVKDKENQITIQAPASVEVQDMFTNISNNNDKEEQGNDQPTSVGNVALDFPKDEEINDLFDDKLLQDLDKIMQDN